MEKSITLRATGATDVWAAVKELRQEVTLPLGTAAAAIKEHTPILLPWATNPSQPWVPPPWPRLMALLDRLEAVGATVQILIDGDPFDRDGFVGRVARTGADDIASRYANRDDLELLGIANGHGSFMPIEIALARKELARRLSNVDAKELLWTANSSHSPDLRRALATEELARRGIDLSSLRVAAGPCHHPRWKPISEMNHACACCSVSEKHDSKVSMDARGYGHGCSKCGYFKQD